jgi:tetratricopeptide (TPR) repeat protein
MATISEALAAAAQHHQAGRLEAAEKMYRQILSAAPDQPDAHHNLGLIAHQIGNHKAAVDYILRAIPAKYQGTSMIFCRLNTLHSFSAFRGRPGPRRVNSNPSRFAVAATHCSPP